MKVVGDQLRFSATDLVGYLNCRHLAGLEHAVAKGELSKPKYYDRLLEALWERGAKHEQDYVEHLASLGLHVVRIDGVEVTDEAVAATHEAMRGGVDVIVQGALRSGAWVGRADILRKVDTPSDLGGWSYVAVDTKLARETKGGTVLQLCLYSELIGEVQGREPEFAHVVPPWTDFVPERYRVSDFGAYYRQVKGGMAAIFTSGDPQESYPEPAAHCEICVWSTRCDKQRRDDDHLCLVAGISSLQIAELKEHGVTTGAQLAELAMPLPWKPERGSLESFTRVREQARVQLESRLAGELKFELLAPVPGFGLACLPEPDEGDIFLDFEGDPFVGEHGLEYLHGFHYIDGGEARYQGLWALDREAEKGAFETFTDFVIARLETYPNLHVYHYGGYEPVALKRLMGRYATPEDELDRLLRGKVLVDLLSVVRHAIRAGVESYSIKKLEPLFGYERDAKLPDANQALSRLQLCLEANDPSGIEADNRATVEAYNRDDCVATRYLRDWLEVERQELVEQGAVIARPEIADGTPSENLSEWLELITPLIEKLTDGVPVDPADRSAEEHGRWVLANLLEWHRREEKAGWWEYFRLCDLSAEDLLDERAGLSGLKYIETVGGTAKCPIDRYSFPAQEADIRPRKGIRVQGGQSVGSVEDISRSHRTVDIDISGFTSELFYEGKLESKEETAGQRVNASGIAGGTGLRFLPIEHKGNQNCSPEEADVIAALVDDILKQGATWVDRNGEERPIGSDDILIIAPYNAQVFEIQQRLPQARVGTVDKFQGQEAPISIYSLASSSHADAPRGMEFLYSLNRLNVATSRAKCVTILVGSPQIFEAECRTPRQMQLANAFCRYRERAL